MKRQLAKKVTICVCVILVIAAGIIMLLWHSGIFVFDRSAKVYVEGMVWNDKNYSMINGQYTEGRTIAKSEDGGWTINEVKEDPSHIFVVARSFLDQRRVSICRFSTIFEVACGSKVTS